MPLLPVLIFLTCLYMHAYLRVWTDEFSNRLAVDFWFIFSSAWVWTGTVTVLLGRMTADECVCLHTCVPTADVETLVAVDFISIYHWVLAWISSDDRVVRTNDSHVEGRHVCVCLHTCVPKWLLTWGLYFTECECLGRWILQLRPSVLWHCWLGGRKSMRPVKNWVVGSWHGYLSGARYRLAYGPADASHCLLLQ